MARLSHCCGACCLLLVSLMAFDTAVAADLSSEALLDEIVVTPTRLPTPRSRVASSTTVITAAEIERRQFRTVAQALQTVPGVQVVRSGGLGQQTSVFLRGANSNQTLLLIDGIEANDPSNPNSQMNFADLLMENIDRIEVVRGPQSVLYGSDAIGGVINIITRKGEGRPSASLRLEGGSDGTFDSTTAISGETDSVNYSAGLSFVDTDGASVTPARLRHGAEGEDDSYRNWTGSTRLGWAAARNTEFNVYGRYIKAGKTKIDPELEDDYGFGTTEDPDAFLDTKQYYLKGEGKSSLLEGRWHSTVAVSYTDYDRKSRNDRSDPERETLDRTDFDGSKLKFEWQNDFRFSDAHVVTAGVETEKEEAKSDGFTAFGSFVLLRETDADARTSAVYLQDQFQFGDRLFGNLGLRVDHHDRFGTEPTFRIAPVYLHKETGTRFSASLGTGFKAPSLDQLYGFAPTTFGSAFRGNPNLDPEKSLGWEVGFEQLFAAGRMSLGATYFWSRIEDLIEVIYLPNFDSTAVNVDEAHIQGLEAFIAADSFPWLSWRADYTYMKPDQDDGRKLLRRPSHRVNARVEMRLLPRLTLDVGALYVADWVDLDRATTERVTPGSYAVLDLAASYAVNRQFTLLGRVDNLTDEHYEPADGFQAPGRAFFAGAKMAW